MSWNDSIIRCIYLLQNTTGSLFQEVCFDLQDDYVINYTKLTIDQSSNRFFSKIGTSNDIDSLWVIVAGFMVFCMYFFCHHNIVQTTYNILSLYMFDFMKPLVTYGLQLCNAVSQCMLYQIYWTYSFSHILSTFAIG